jgi:hypothetical protein
MCGKENIPIFFVELCDSKEEVIRCGDSPTSAWREIIIKYREPQDKEKGMSLDVDGHKMFGFKSKHFHECTVTQKDAYFAYLASK